ncbi:RDD family protein [Herbiconiux liukaitaii]|uniref:RDD family protein n=1 Tax=Herbiconiux liukaitaii TaxID=3342799 RepID=UPI0035B7A0FB
MTDATSYPCVQCGSPVPRSAQFCLVCGTPSSMRSQSAALGQVPGQAAMVDSSGRPMDGWRPEPAAPPIRYGDIIPSGFGRRLVAFLLDGVFGTALWLIITLPLTALGIIQVETDGSTFSANGLSAVLLLLPALLYPVANLLLQAFAGFSLGKLIMGLRIVNVAKLGKPGIGWMLLRNLVVAAGALVFAVGQYVVYLSPLWDGEKRMRGWQDKVARTWVIDIKAGPNPLKARPGQLLLDDGAYTSPAEREPAAAPAAPAPAPSAAAPALPEVDYAPRAAAPLPPLAEPIASVPGFAPAITPAQAAADDFESTRLTDSVRPPSTSGVTVFRLDTGEVVPIIRHGALGRDPVAPGGDPSDVLIALSGDTLSVSKTHLEFGVDSGAVWVSDRGSTNGSALVRADGVEYPLEPGERLTVVPGDRVRVGTRLFSVETGA